MDHVDGVAVLDLVLGRREQVGGQAGVGRRIRAAGRGAGHGMRAHDVAGAGDEQLGTGADEAVGGEEHAGRIAATQLGQHGLARDGTVGLDDDLPRQHDLAGRARPQLVSGVHQRLAPLVGRPGTRDGEPGRIGVAVGGGDVEVGEPARGIGRADGRHPARTVLGPPDEDLGHDQPALAARVERERADRHRPGAGQPERIVHLDRVAARRAPPPTRPRDRRRGRGCAAPRPGRRTRRGPASTAPRARPPPRSGRGRGRVVRCGPASAGVGRGSPVGSEPERAHRAGSAACGRSRVAVSSWAMPPESRSRPASAKPARRSWSTQLGRIGQVGDRLGQVAVGGRVRQQTTDAGHHLAEVHAVTPAHDRVGRHGHLEQGDAATWSDHAGQFVEERHQRDEVAQCESARHPVDRRVRDGQDAARRPGRAARPTGRRPACRTTGRSRSARAPGGPVRRRGRRCRTRRRAPVAPGASASRFTVRRRHPTSMRNVMMRLTRS